MPYKARVYVTLRASVLDPAGTAVQKAIQEQMNVEIQSVRIGKFIEIFLDSPDQTRAHQTIQQICEQFLANPVIEDFCFELDEIPGVSNLASQG